MTRSHNPDHVAALAAVIVSSRPEPELHHIKAAVASARAVLDEAHRCAKEDEASWADAPADSGPDVLGERAGGEKTEDQGTDKQ